MTKKIKTPRFTRAVYTLIAETLNESSLHGDEKAKLALDFCLKLQADNSRFDRSRFIKAVMGE